MRLEIVKKFLSTDECTMLNQWVENGIKDNLFDLGFGLTDSLSKRATTRRSGGRFKYPDEIIAISNKIREYVGVSDCPLVEGGHGRDGIVVSCTFEGGNVFKHFDPPVHPTLSTLRCNVMTQKPVDGGVLHIDGKPIDLEAGDLHCYLASEHEHHVDQVVGKTPRILWMFGALVDKKSWDNNVIKFGDM